MSDTLDKDTVIFNPSEYYKTPADIVHDQKLTRDEKVAALANWKLDLSLRRVAEEENMRPLSKVNPNEVRLEDKIIAALAELNENPTFSGTKFGSI